MIENGDKIIFFDGVCNLCNRAIRIVIRRDRKAVFKFASLQSDLARRLIGEETIQSNDSVVFLDGDELYDRSEAVLKIMPHLGGIWKIATIFKVLPKKLRDGIYDFIAGKRYAWFGKKDACMVPGPDVQHRFLK